MRVKVWTNTRPLKLLDVLELSQLYRVGDASPYGPVVEILPSVVFDEVGIDQSVSVEPDEQVTITPENSIFRPPSRYNKITLYPIYSGGRHPWDENALANSRYEIMERVTIENVSSMISEETFSLWRKGCHLSRAQAENFENIKYALVHRYSTEHSREAETDKESQRLIGTLSVCLLVVRPMRRSHAGIVTGIIREDGTVEAQGFGVTEPVEVPHVQKQFYLREPDIETFRAIAPNFLTAVKEREDRYEPLRMAIQFFEQGHIHDQWWKVRHMLWWSAMEALFGNKSHKLIIRVLSFFGNKDMLKGEKTSIYEPTDIPSFADYKPRGTIGDTLEELYAIRNMIAHGRKVPSKFLTPVPHMFGNADGQVEILAEAASFIIRKTLVRILAENLLSHFEDVDTREDYWLNVFGIDRHQADKKFKELAAKEKLEKAKQLEKKRTKAAGPVTTLSVAQKRETRLRSAKATKARSLPE